MLYLWVGWGWGWGWGAASVSYSSAFRRTMMSEPVRIPDRPEKHPDQLTHGLFQMGSSSANAAVGSWVGAWVSEHVYVRECGQSAHDKCMK